MSASFDAPPRVLLQQFNVELVQATSLPHITWVVLDLANGGDARQQQEEADVLGKAWLIRRNGLGDGEVFGFENNNPCLASR